MLPKAAPLTTLGALTSRDDTSIEDDESSQLQLVTIGRLKEVIERMDINNVGLKAKIKDIGTIKVKMPSIERFDGARNKLKGFLT